jgi:hypothetical protein
MRKKVYLLPVYHHLLKSLLTTLPREKYGSWIYLGKDFRTCKKLETLIGTRADRIHISDDLQECARLHREDYLDYIGEVFTGCDSPVWFLSALAEKNPFASDFFLHFCYLAVSLDQIRTTDTDLIIIGENRAVLASIVDNLKDDSSVEIIRYDSGLLSIAESARFFCTKNINILVFLSRFFLRILLARLFSLIKMRSRKLTSGDPVILTHTWTDSRSFPVNGVYHEAYLGNLCDNLKTQTGNFFYLSDVLPTLWYPKALFRLVPVKSQLFLMEEFLSVADPLKALVHVRTQYPDNLKEIPLSGLDVGALVRNDLFMDRQTTRVEQTYLNYAICNNISLQIPVRSFLYTFENHVWEKAFCDGIKKVGDTRLIAYAIVFVNRMYTCYSLSETEKLAIPQPDVLLVSGAQGKEMLEASGFEGDSIIIGGAVRYPNLQKTRETPAAGSGKNIVLALSGEINSSLELVFKSLDAFSHNVDLHIIIKCHPTIPFSKLSPFLPALPGHFSVSEEMMETLLGKADLVMYTESTVSVEAAFRGIPVIQVRSDHTIDINIFEGEPSVPSCANPKDICRHATRILNGDETLPPNDVITHLFSPIDMQKITSVILK